MIYLPNNEMNFLDIRNLNGGSYVELLVKNSLKFWFTKDYVPLFVKQNLKLCKSLFSKVIHNFSGNFIIRKQKMSYFTYSRICISSSIITLNKLKSP